MNEMIKLIETIEDEIEWAKENIPYAEPLDNVDTADVERLLELAKGLHKQHLNK